MADREKVIEGLKNISDAIVDGYITEPNKACNTICDAIELLKEQESLKQKMWNALYAEEDKLENHYVGTDEFDKWIVDYRPFLQRGFEIAIEVIAAHEEGR